MKKKKKSKRGVSKKKMTAEQSTAHKYVSEWVFLGQSSMSSNVDEDGFGLPISRRKFSEKLVFEFHSHSNCSDGFLSPSKLVQRAHQNGVRVLALTDHDTMSGVTEAVDAARRFDIKIIPGVEISTIYTPSGGSSLEEPVHILAYYSSCGPAGSEELDKFLGGIRDGRFLRAKNMVSKLNRLELPLKWELVAKIAGKGVAPGRLHVARAMVQAGYVENLKQAFDRYLYDGGPAYSKGSEPLAEEAVHLICKTGGVAVLAHPWTLKNPFAIVRKLKDAGLHGIEVYRSDGKLTAYSDLAEAYDLMKLGGSDFHGRGGHSESELGSVNLPISAVQEFLKTARSIWCSAIRIILENYAEDPSKSKLERILKFGKTRTSSGTSLVSSNTDSIDLCLPSWLTKEERQDSDFDAIRLKLSHIAINHEAVNGTVTEEGSSLE